jgi:NAD(P)-dependent dehydrogenase (short-subunit alcohol dehydrogenase family)
MSKIWMITGSSRGLGLQIARTALEAGETVVATARRAATVTAALGDSERLLALPLDVTDASAASAAVNAAVERFGRIDVLVNNAGYGHFGPFEEATEQDVEEQFRVNIFGAMHVTRAVLPHMRSLRSGRIFNISSVAGIAGFSMSSLYCGSKFAMEGWSESLTMELEPLGIQVTAVEPGFFRTEFLAEESVRYIEARHPEYREGMAGMQTWLNGQHGKQGGDPARLAQVLLDLTRKKQQPMHLLMGGDAVVRMTDRIKRDSESTAEWQSVSESTDFPS